MKSKITKNRQIAFKKQSGRCYYCGGHMWQISLESFAQIYKISVTEAAKLQCTAEHLTARSEGGSDDADNIVAACLFCNRTRHYSKRPKSPENFKKHVRGRITKGKWHSKDIIQRCISV